MKPCGAVRGRPSFAGEECELEATDQIDALIGKRARMEEQNRAEEMAWRESVRKHRAAERRRLFWEWIRHHEHMQRLHEGLAAEHAARALELSDRRVPLGEGSS